MRPASCNYLAERGRPSVSGDLTGHDLLAVDESLLDLPEARWLAARAGSARVVLRTNSTLAQLEAVRAGVGLALLPRFLCEVAGLERASPPSQGITRQLWLAVHPDLQHAVRVRAVIEFLAARAGWLERGPWRSRVPR